MSIKLEWQVESDQSVDTVIGEDPDARRKRHQNYLAALVTLGFLVGLVVGGVAFLIDQVNQIQEEFERDLTDTVQAEITALRIGDWNAFAGFQRSATDDWLREQRTEFEAYQELLLASDNTELTGQVLDVEIDPDQPRARVRIQEIIDGVPFSRVWFYWFYEEDTDTDGDIDFVAWRHVPPDYTFWGEPLQFDGKYVSAAYTSVDAEFGEAASQSVDAWIGSSCLIVDCAALPPIRLQISPQDGGRIAWSSSSLDADWMLIVPSPYTDRARSDQPFSPEIRLDVATLLAERLIAFQTDGRTFVQSADTNFLYQSAIRWLIGRFAQIDTGSYLMASLAAQYGEGTVGQLLKIMPGDGNISVLSQAIGVSLHEAPLDWRDFFTWRLEVEDQAINQLGRLSDVLSLYDTRDTSLAAAAEQRLQQGFSTARQVAVNVGSTTPAQDGSPQVAVMVANPPGQEPAEFQILFRLVENNWKRAS